MKDLVAPHLSALAPYEPGKPESELKRELGVDRVVKLASNENPYGPSPRVLAAIKDGPLELHRYPDPRGFDLRRALAAHHGVSADELCLGNGSNELIDLICRVFASPGEHVVYGQPSFACYSIGAVAQQLERGVVPLRDDLHWNVDDLLAAVTPTTKLLFLANPNNPTGAYVPGAELRRLLRSLPNEVIAVIDEAYVEYPDAPDFESAERMRDEHEATILLRTFSKAYGLAALRVGYAIAPSMMIGALNRLRPPFNVGTLGQLAAIEALADPAHLEQSVQATRRDRRKLADALGELGLTVAPSQANFVLVDVQRSGRAVFEALLGKGVIVRAMPAPLQQWLRVTVGRPDENARFIEALQEVLEETTGE